MGCVPIWKQLRIHHKKHKIEDTKNVSRFLVFYFFYCPLPAGLATKRGTPLLSANAKPVR